MIISTIKIKKVKNPLENDNVLKRSLEEGPKGDCPWRTDAAA